MKAYVAIKYKSEENAELIDTITSALKKRGIEPFCFVRDFQFSNKETFSAEELMKKAFEYIKACDVVIVDITEIAVGVGIEAGYAYSLGIPILTISQKGSETFNTLKGISKDYLLYESLDELSSILKEYFTS